MMKYKSYKAVVEYDEDAEIFHGEVINLCDVITFQGKSASELKKALVSRGLSGVLQRAWRGAGKAVLGSICRPRGAGASQGFVFSRQARRNEPQQVGNLHVGEGRIARRVGSRATSA
jgi:hypothetical protein